MERLTLVIVLAVLAAPFTGCIGSEEANLEPQSNNSTVPALEPAAEAVSTYRVTPEANATTVDPAPQLPDGVPLPSGTGFVAPGPLFEPTIGATSDGTLFVSNTGKGELSEEPVGSTDTAYSSILRSTDQGRTWEDVTGSVGPVSIPPETSDPYVYVDRDTARVYNLDMIQLNCNWVRFSDDKGDSWTNNPAGCGQPPVLDHPTLFAGEPTTLATTTYENVLYLCVNRIADSACTVSLDGGLTFGPFRTVYQGAQADGSFCGGLHAHGTTGPDGTAYLPRGVCGTPKVAVSTDNGLTWTQHTITDNVSTIGHEVAIATDGAGTLFAFWINEDLQPYLAYSTDKGASWSTPIEVSPPDVPITSHPTIAAGSNGSVAMAYVGTTASASSYADVPDNATWNGYMTVILNATESDPTVFTTTANDPDDPIARGECGGTRCRAEDDAGIGDFIDVTIDDEGRPWAAFVDVCLEACEQTGESKRTNGVGLIGTLAEGPSLRGEVSALTPLDPANATTTNTTATRLG